MRLCKKRPLATRIAGQECVPCQKMHEVGDEHPSPQGKSHTFHTYIRTRLVASTPLKHITVGNSQLGHSLEKNKKGKSKYLKPLAKHHVPICSGVIFVNNQMRFCRIGNRKKTSSTVQSSSSCFRRSSPHSVDA